MSLKILVLADSHGDTKKVVKIIRAEAPFDMLIHAGDGITDLKKVTLPENSSVRAVLGNVDVANNIPGDRIEVEECGNFTLLVAHGDQYGVKNGLEQIKKEAQRFSADLVIFGHLHQQILEKGSPILFNPGNASNGFYGVIDISDHIYCSHRKLSEG